MKRFFTLLLSSLFSLSLFAYNGNRLSISSSNYTMNLRIEVDGQQVIMQSNRVTLNNLSEGNHNVRIYREKRTNESRRITASGKFEIIYATSVYLGNAYQVDIVINQLGKVQLASYSIDPDDYWFYDNDDSGSYSGSNNAVNSNSNLNNYTVTGQEINMVKQTICKQRS